MSVCVCVCVCVLCVCASDGVWLNGGVWPWQLGCDALGPDHLTGVTAKMGRGCCQKYAQGNTSGACGGLPCPDHEAADASKASCKTCFASAVPVNCTSMAFCTKTKLGQEPWCGPGEPEWSVLAHHSHASSLCCLLFVSHALLMCPSIGWLSLLTAWPQKNMHGHSHNLCAAGVDTASPASGATNAAGASAPRWIAWQTATNCLKATPVCNSARLQPQHTPDTVQSAMVWARRCVCMSFEVCPLFTSQHAHC